MNPLRIPLWNQLNDPLPDGNQDPFASTDCGEECVAMVGGAYGFGGVCGYAAGQVRVIIRRGNIGGIGLSTPSDLVYGLKACFKLNATIISGSWAMCESVLKAVIPARRPVILLGNWDGAPHWVVCCAVNNEGLASLDPWGGYVRHDTWEDAARLYDGSAVVLSWPLP